MGAASIEPWSRQRLQVVLGILVALALLLLVGVGLWINRAVSSTEQSPATPAGEDLSGPAKASGQAERDRIAAKPMLAVDPVDAREGTPAAKPAPTMTIPASTRTGPADVPTGFPQTPQGAVAQLAAIGRSATEGMSVPYTAQIHKAWTMPGAPSASQWQLTENVRVFLEAAGQPGQSAGTSVSVTATPAGAQVKGRDGTGWVLACVLYDVKASVVQEARTGWGYCERMQWDEADRVWKIAPGDAPAPAPSTWPGSAKASEAGWRTWAGPEEG